MIEVTEDMLEAINELIDNVVSNNYGDPNITIERIIELHEANKPKPEPVAYRWWNQGCNCDECDQYFYSEDPDFISKNREPLYTTPPTREPLSEDTIYELAEVFGEFAYGRAAKIQVMDSGGYWIDVDKPTWKKWLQYRIKPTSKNYL